VPLSLGISTQSIGQTFQLALSSRRYGYFIHNDRQYEVIGQLDRKDRSAPFDLKSLYLKSGSGEMVSLDNVTKQNEGISPPAIYRYNQSYSAPYRPLRRLGEFRAKPFRNWIKSLPKNYRKVSVPHWPDKAVTTPKVVPV
jgi:hypothetical protein